VNSYPNKFHDSKQASALCLMSALPPQEPEDPTSYPQPTPTPTAFNPRTSACLDWVAVIDEALHHLKALLEEEIHQ